MARAKAKVSKPRSWKPLWIAVLPTTIAYVLHQFSALYLFMLIVALILGPELQDRI